MEEIDRMDPQNKLKYLYDIDYPAWDLDTKCGELFQTKIDLGNELLETLMDVTYMQRDIQRVSSVIKAIKFNRSRLLEIINGE